MTGFASYFMPGLFIVHTLAEVWDASAFQWRLVNVAFAVLHTVPNDGTMLDAFDLPQDRFVRGDNAWRGRPYLSGGPQHSRDAVLGRLGH